MTVIYDRKVSTKFTWHWPQHTVRTYSTVQTKPYHYTGRLLHVDQNVDVSSYRFHYPQKTSFKEWGYYFAPGTRLYNGKPYPIFASPNTYQEAIQNK